MDSSFLDAGGMPEPILPIELNPSVFRPFAYRVLSKKYGLNVQSSALEKLASYVGRRFGTKWKKDPKTSAFLDAVAKLWKEQGRGIFIDGNGVTQVIKEIIANEQRTKVKKKMRQQEDIEPENSSFIDTTAYDSSMVMSSQSMDQTDEGPKANDDDDTVDWKMFFKVVDVNHYTRFVYDERRKIFDYTADSDSSNTIQLPGNDDVLNFYNTRLDLLRDRIYRNDIFSKVKYDTSGQSKVINQTHRPKHITAVKNLLGRNEQRFVLFGLVTLNSFGIWQLQDDTDKIELVLRQCIFPAETYFVSGNFLIVDGFYSSAGKFHVLSVSHPPAEDRSTTIDALAYLDFNWDFSKNGKVDLTMKSLTLKQIKQHKDHKIVVLGGNLYLNELEIISKVRKTLLELETELEFSLQAEKSSERGEETATNIHDRTIAIIFNGPFVSKALTVTEGSSPNHMTSSGLYKASFDNLATILEQFKNICEHCKLIFVPGDEDPWMSMVTKNSNSIWPKMRIPSVFGTRLSRVAKNVVWAYNPCRLNYLSQDIVIVRDDAGESLRRNDFSYLCELSKEEIEKAIKRNDEEMIDEVPIINSQDLEIDKLTLRENADITRFKKIIRTLLDQGILSPFVYKTRQILPNYWPILSVMPLPDCIVMSDTTAPTLTTMYKGCLVSNVGKFYEDGRAHYLEYYPSSQSAKMRVVY